MYNHSAANGGMSADLVAKMFCEIDHITGVKWTVNNYYELMRLKDLTHGEMNVINGPDEMLICGLAAGADAGIGTTYIVMLPQFLEIYKKESIKKPPLMGRFFYVFTAFQNGKPDFLHTGSRSFLSFTLPVSNKQLTEKITKEPQPEKRADSADERGSKNWEIRDSCSEI